MAKKKEMKFDSLISMTPKNAKSAAVSIGASVFAFNCLYGNFADFDLWGYLAFGRLFWGGEGFPYKDVFSYAPTKELWVYHEWLTGVIFFPVYKATGAVGLQILKYSLAFLTLLIAFLTSRSRGSNPSSFLIALILACNTFAYGYSPVRAQVFTYLFFALSIYLLEKARKNHEYRALWWLLPIELLWCNLHGGFVVGIGVIGIYTLVEALSGKSFWPFLRIMGLSVVVTLINPYGLDYLIYIKEAVLMPRPDIGEWRSLFYCLKNGLYLGQATLFSISIIISLVICVWHKRKKATPILILVVTAYLGVSHIRHVVFFALAFMIFMPSILTDFWTELLSGHGVGSHLKRIKYFLLIFILIFVADFSFSFFKKAFFGNPLDLKLVQQKDSNASGSYYPVRALKYMRDRGLKGNILPLFEWGEYIAWSLSPGCLVGMDGRYETVYTEIYSREYFDFLYSRGNWKDFLRKYPHEMILIKTKTKLNLLLQKEPEWMKVYQDKKSVLYIKKGRLKF